MTKNASKRVVNLNQRFEEEDLESMKERFEEEPAGSPWVGYGFVNGKKKLPTQLKIFYAPNSDGPLTLRQPAPDRFELVDDNDEVVWSGDDLNDFFIESALGSRH